MAKLTSQEVIKYPLISEDAVSLIESENKIVFIVDLKARKRDVIQAVESLYEVEVEGVNTVITHTGTKKAYVKLVMEEESLVTPKEECKFVHFVGEGEQIRITPKKKLNGRWKRRTL